jgi:tRNA(fMet)-specific endonuclease VapC
MNYCLDTNTCIYYLNNSILNLCKRLDEIPFRDIKIPSVVVAELLYGAEKSARREYNFKIINAFLSLYKIADFDEKAASFYATIRTELERSGQRIGGNDLMIAATTLSFDATLVTHNVSEFSRINELKLEDWAI